MILRRDIIEYLEKEIEKRCKSENNFFGIGVFYHTKAVVKNSTILAKKYGGDIEVVTIAAWLHDVASITDYEYYEEHHIYGAEIAKEILEKFDYDKEKIQLVQKCILNHRGSKIREKTTIEELCVADADAISHFDAIPSLFFLTYVNRKLDIEEGNEFVKNKLKRSYNKLSDRSKMVYSSKYKKVMELLNT